MVNANELISKHEAHSILNDVEAQKVTAIKRATYHYHLSAEVVYIASQQGYDAQQYQSTVEEDTRYYPL